MADNDEKNIKKMLRTRGDTKCHTSHALRPPGMRKKLHVRGTEKYDLVISPTYVLSTQKEEKKI